jgi:hypothetical protein
VVYQFVATKIDEYRYPAPGEMVDVGGYSLHLYCTGEGGGAPTVVMDSGLGGTVLDWQLVQLRFNPTTNDGSGDVLGRCTPGETERALVPRALARLGGGAYPPQRPGEDLRLFV